MTLCYEKVMKMASIGRIRIGYILNHFTHVVTKTSFNFNKAQAALFHCSFFLNGSGQEIKMPSLSPTMEEGKIVKWLKKEGDTVVPGDVLCDIETDKAIVSMEIEEEGILAKILVPENTSSIKVGSPIAVMVSEGEDWKNIEIPPQGVADSLSKSSSSSSSSSSQSSQSGEEGGEPIIKGPPTIPITMPSLSPTMTAGTIIKWLKKEGDTISPGDVLCEIQTDKAVMSLETEEEGVLAKIIAPDDSKDVQVGTLIALIVNIGEDWKSVQVVSGSPAKKTEDPPQKTSTPSVTPGSVETQKKPFGPAVKRLLTDYQLDPGIIKSTGVKNRLLKGDVLKYIEDNKLAKKPPKTEALPLSKPTSSKPEVSLKQTKAAPRISSYIDIELSSMRQTIAKRLIQSKSQIPHAYSMVKCEVDNLMKSRAELLAGGTRVSVNDFIIKATALALQIYPKANALCVNNEVKTAHNIDINIAVATEEGLITPIVKSTDLKSLTAISQEVKELSAKAKEKKLKPEEFLGGTFTISNLGMFGITYFSAIINPPQCAILAVGGTLENLKPDLTVCKEMILTLSYDRRAMQEHEAGEFMQALKHVIENPKLILLGESCDASQSVL